MVKQTSSEIPTAEERERRDSCRYKGVRKRKWGKWVSEIRLPNSRERIWLGSYDTAEKAARAFDAALFCLRGRTAKFNFPENPPEIAGGRSLSPAEIQSAAARFANSEDPMKRSDRPVPELRMESETPSPSPSVSEGSVTVQLDSELTTDGSFMDMFTNIGLGNYASDYGLFPGFDDLSGDFFMPPPPTIDYGEENYNVDAVFPQESFLWNF
ncbi:Ethylene-responsive transcription factor [Morus notabilis]|uniref:Dehydration responsive element binding transcription factor n=1 Tax=Morus notabilis TaxID=981085 RepID=W6FFV7_9ROSA|nr:ethylene-responsive transcription factor ERF017 [Morus notabilis]AHJ25975.1 dehydration responsive element binding transcription factor [Morus notabilis]EXB76737.1 Ethylene-responsive transcription factor [Morus notabilis]